ncbi:MAG: hypothetical protein N3G77_04015 [Nitrososphaeria archaeon]|nr:hypothetical protein [Nitrososphaeria archaeon]
MDIEPLHAQAFFKVNGSSLFSEILIFDYYDREQYYYHLIESEDRYRREMESLLTVMNEFLREEKVLVNKKEVEVEPIMVSLDFRGSPELPTITYLIEFHAKLFNGLNEYECYYEEGMAEYDYEVYWIFPVNAKITEVEISGEYEILNDRILIINVRRGEYYNGYEKIVFKL